MSDITANRHKGAATSVEAHDRIKKTLPRQRAAVLALYRARPSGYTVHEVAEKFNVSPNVISGRLSELKKSGLLFPSGERRGNAAVLKIKEDVV
jgi:DNA-binding transcriptional ArsR family regulator